MMNNNNVERYINREKETRRKKDRLIIIIMWKETLRGQKTVGERRTDDEEYHDKSITICK